VLVNEGEPTAAEVALGHAWSALPVGTRDDVAEGGATPSEDDVLDLAGAWAVDPRELEHAAARPSTGWVGSAVPGA